MPLRSSLALSGMLIIAHRYHACTGNEAPLSTGLILENGSKCRNKGTMALSILQDNVTVSSRRPEPYQ